MAQLDAMNRRTASGSVCSSSTVETPLSPSSSDLHSPTLDPSTPEDSAPPKPEVQDWIAKARESIEAFGGLIALGGPATVHENSAESDEEEYAFDVEDSLDDDEDTAGEDRHIRRSQSPSVALKKSQLTEQTGILPHKASPFGLMAHLSIRNNARGKSAEPEPQDAVGVAGSHFFIPCEYRLCLSTPPGSLFRLASVPDPARSNPPMSSHCLPHILTRDVITVKDAENLFKL